MSVLRSSRIVRNAAVLISAAGILIGGYLGFTYWLEKSLMPVSHIDIEGRLDKDEDALVRSRLAQFNGFDFDLSAVKSELESISWIEWVGVRRIWPNGLQIRLGKYRAVARWGEEAYLTADGQIFIPASKIQAKLPELNGPVGSERLVMGQYQQLNGALQQSEQGIESLSLKETGEWSLRLKNQVLVKLGKDDISDRMQRLLQVLEGADLVEKLATMTEIDARYSNGIAVNWKAGSCSENCYELAGNDNIKRAHTL